MIVNPFIKSASKQLIEITVIHSNLLDLISIILIQQRSVTRPDGGPPVSDPLLEFCMAESMLEVLRVAHVRVLEFISKSGMKSI